MSFRDNLQHLRATRNLTQEQLAMLLGVSRQSVSKWEAERAYPEMDKLLKLCDLFGCTLDELVSGDLTGRPTDVASHMPQAKAPQDVTGYDEAMRAFALKVSLGAGMPLVGLALCMLVSGIVPVPGIEYYASVFVFAGLAAGLALVVPACFGRTGFRKTHPFVEDFYTAEQKGAARSAMSTGIVAGTAFVLAALASAVLLRANIWFASAASAALAAMGAFFVVRGCLLGVRCDLAAYNRKSLRGLDDEGIGALDGVLQTRARRARREGTWYKIVMSVATAVGLVLLFAPVAAAQRLFWLAWPIGGLACGAIRAFFSMRRDE